ncbi:DAK2 domain-containing protein [Actinoplanes flavus]|uniref:DAK2 domain-containing protein n=1 Tax=Actinoplanes flavus TaxID=2820290 RepID=UPI0027DE522C|nr:DAK2 domain-containing protein [Actinoplanes flavus]
MLETLDAAAVRRWCDGGLEALRAHQREIDDLNVYPVPDGDTGTNLVLTLTAAHEAVAGPVDPEPGPEGTTAVARLMRRMARGALLGARGNSGVIVSQILRGMADAFAAAVAVRGGELARALRTATDAAYAAVARPVEGTVLSVVAAAAEGAGRTRSDDLATVARAAARAAAEALERTPQQLPVLARAGVVDAGGRGLCLLLDALVEVVAGRDAPPAVSGGDTRPVVSDGDARPVVSGGDTRSVVSGGDTRPVVSGGDTRPLMPGGDAPPAVPGGDAPSVVPGGDAPSVVPSGEKVTAHGGAHAVVANGPASSDSGSGDPADPDRAVRTTPAAPIGGPASTAEPLVRSGPVVQEDPNRWPGRENTAQAVPAGENQAVRAGETPAGQEYPGQTAWMGDDQAIEPNGEQSTRVGEGHAIRASNEQADRVGEGQAARAGEGHAVRAGEGQAVRAGDEQADRVGEGHAARVGEGHAARVGEDQAIRVGEGHAARVGEGQAVRASDEQADRAGESQAIRVGEGHAVRAGEGQTAGEGQLGRAGEGRAVWRGEGWGGPAHEDECAGYGFEVQYLLEATEEAVSRLRGILDGLGDSLVVVGTGDGDPPTWNVHVHVTDVGPAIEAGVEAGRPFRIRVTPLVGHRPGPDRRAAVVVAAGDGLTALFEAEGAVVVDRNPSTAELLAAVHSTGAGSVVLLPNDANTQAVAVSAAREAEAAGVRVSVVPTRSPVQALAALAVRDEQRPFADDVIAMAEAAGACRYGEVCTAQRDALTVAGPCRAGDLLGLVDGEVHVIGGDLTEVSHRLLDRMLGGGGELVTLVLGAAAPPGLEADLRGHVHRTWPFIELQCYAGGQPRYHLLAGVE